jgi:hypothetical protein
VLKEEDIREENGKERFKKDWSGRKTQEENYIF